MEPCSVRSESPMEMLSVRSMLCLGPTVLLKTNKFLVVPLFILLDAQESVLATVPRLGQADAPYSDMGRNSHSCHFNFIVQRDGFY